jgi:DNA polymerase III subunit beta
MHFKINRSLFLHELNFLQGAVEKKATVPILGCLLVEARGGGLTLKATDLDVSVVALCEAEVRAEGSACLPARKLVEIIKSLPNDEVEIKSGGADGQWQTAVACRQSRFKLLGQDPSNFPEPPAFTGEYAAVPAAMFSDFIARTVFAVTQEESRYALNGAKLEISEAGVRMVATDGHRLAFVEREGRLVDNLAVEVIVPRKTLLELARLCAESEDSLEIGKDDNHLFFRLGRRSLVSRLLAGQFPNYSLVLSKDNHECLSVERGAVAGAVRRVALMADERSRAVKITVGDGEMTVTSQAPDVGEAGETLAVDYRGAGMTAGFNATYLNDFFSAVGDDRVVFEFRDGNSQVRLRSEAEGEDRYLMVIMPMRLN